MSSRLENVRSSERVTSDLLPECVCGDINAFGATRCDGCGRKLAVPAASHAHWTRERILDAAHAWHHTHGFQPTSSAWSKGAPEHPSANMVQHRFGSWTAMMRAAGFGPGRPGPRLVFTRKQAAQALFEWRMAHGRLPKKNEWDRFDPNDPSRPTAPQVLTLFGSWNAFLVAAGYEPEKYLYREVDGYRKQATRRLRELRGDPVVRRRAA